MGAELEEGVAHLENFRLVDVGVEDKNHGEGGVGEVGASVPAGSRALEEGRRDREVEVAGCEVESLGGDR